MIYHGIILTDVMFRLRSRPLGAYRIANVLREAGYNILVIDMYSTLPLEELKSLLDKTISQDTLFLGYSSTFFASDPHSDRLVGEHPYELAFPTTRDYFIDTNMYAKSLNSNIKILYGGASVHWFIKTTQNEDRDLLVDLLVDGYSESMIVDVVDNIRDNSPQQTSKYVKTAGYINYDKEAKNYDFRNHLHQWHESDNILPGEPLPLEIARGCVFKCKFCSFPLLGKKKNDMSYIRTEERLLEEILTNYDKYQTRHYMILDDTFNERTDKLEMLCRVRDKTKLDLQFGSYIRLDLVSRKPEQIPLLRDLNLVFQNYGIESLTRKAAAAIGKGCDPEELIETIYKINDAMHGKVSMEAGHIIGLPYETPETLEASISRLVETPVDIVNFQPLKLMQSAYGKSDIWSNPEFFGYTVIDDPYIPGKQTWKNDIWDYETCFNLAQYYENLYIESGRTKLGGTVGAFGMINLGYDFLATTKMTIKEFRSEKVVAETKERYAAHRQAYFNSLNAYLDSKK